VGRRLGVSLPANPRWAFARYRAVDHRLPVADRGYPPFSVKIKDLRDVFHRYDGFILDAFGVLNIGDGAIPGAVERIAQMRAAGKRLVVLTNGASKTRAEALATYHRWGFDFAEDEVISSRDLAAAALAGRRGIWAAIAPEGSQFNDLPGDVRALDARLLDEADGFLFLGSQGWTEAKQAALVAALRARAAGDLRQSRHRRPAREQGFTWEPGHYAHDLPVPVEFHGKPFGPALQAALDRLGLPARKVAMVGDTLHTDILGGRAAGCFTVLIAGHGFFAGTDPQPYITASGITPDFIAETT